MATDSPRSFVPSTPGVPKTLGILNIIFGAILAACGVCLGISVVVNTAMQPKIIASWNQAREQAFARRQAALEDLDKREKAAKTEEEKEDIKAERKVLARDADLAELDPMKMVPMDVQKRMNTMWVIDSGVVFALNGLMIASGIGLVALREWGRKLALWVAGLKMVRLAFVLAVGILVVVPTIVRLMDSVTDQAMKMARQQAAIQGKAAPAGIPPQARSVIVKTTGIMYSSFFVVYVILSLIYPSIMLWMLTRPGARAACQQPQWLEPSKPPGLEI